jgi:hypothetical protein
MTTERDILQALEGLPTSVLEQIKDFIIFLKEKGTQHPRRKQKVLAEKQKEVIKKWAGTNLGPGFSGKEYEAILYKT